MASTEASPSFSRPWMVANALAAIAFVGLMADVPLVFIPGASLDDGLFIKTGGYIASGYWLGTYSDTTLAKGPVYPLFVAINWILGLPILVTQAIAYAAACLCLVRGLRPLLRSEAATLLVYVLLLFNPAVYAFANLRVMREGLYVPLTVLLLALGLHWYHRRARPLRDRLWLAIGFGLTFGFFWCTREEGPWIAPALLCGIAAICGAEIVRSPGKRWAGRISAARAPLTREGALMGIAAAAALIVWLGFATMNLIVYGVGDVVEVKQREFLSAYGAFTRIRSDGPPTAYVVVRHAARMKAYAVSPAAAELQNTLEGEVGSAMAVPGCITHGIDPCDNELRAGWFIWAVRSAAAINGYHRSAPEARAFYRRLAAELNAACDDGRLSCLPPRATLAPPFRMDDVPPTLAAARRALGFMVGYADAALPEHPMSCVIDDCGGPLAWAQFLDMVHTTRFVLIESPPPGFTRRSQGQDPSQFDLDKYMQMERAARALPFAYRAAIVARILKAVVEVYRAAMPAALGLAVIAFLGLAALALIRRSISPLLVVASIAAITVLSRIALLAYLEATSMPSINSLYLSPAYPLMLLFVATAIAGAVLAVIDMRRKT